MAETDTKVNPPEQAESAAEPKLDKEPTEKATTGEVEGNKSTTETVTDNASSAPSAVKDKVFSMFGGGPKREKKEEPEDVDEPSGSSKAKKEEAETVCFSHHANSLTEIFADLRADNTTHAGRSSRRA